MATAALAPAVPFLAAAGPPGWVALGVGAAVLTIGSLFVARELARNTFPETAPSPVAPCPHASPPLPPPPPTPPPVGPLVAAGVGVAVGVAVATRKDSAPQSEEEEEEKEPYSDQTCTNEVRNALTKKKKAILREIPAIQPPKNRIPDDTEKNIKKRQQLCDKLRRKLDAQKRLRDTREEMQRTCFDSPKVTEDEKKRDEGHRTAMEQSKKAIANTEEEIRIHC